MNSIDVDTQEVTSYEIAKSKPLYCFERPQNDFFISLNR